MKYGRWRNPWDSRPGRVNLEFLGTDNEPVENLSDAVSVWADEVAEDGTVTRKAFALVEAPRGFPPDFGPLFFDTGWKASGGLCASCEEYRHEWYGTPDVINQEHIDRVYEDVRRSDPHADWRRMPAHSKAQMFEWFRAHPPSPDLAASKGRTRTTSQSRSSRSTAVRPASSDAGQARGTADGVRSDARELHQAPPSRREARAPGSCLPTVAIVLCIGDSTSSGVGWFIYVPALSGEADQFSLTFPECCLVQSCQARRVMV